MRKKLNIVIKFHKDKIKLVRDDYIANTKQMKNKLQLNFIPSSTDLN